MKRRRFVATAAVVTAGAAAGLPLALRAEDSVEAEYRRILARFRAATIRAHGEAAYERYRDILEYSARTYCRQRERPWHEERIAALERIWVKQVADFENDACARWFWP